MARRYTAASSVLYRALLRICASAPTAKRGDGCAGGRTAASPPLGLLRPRSAPLKISARNAPRRGSVDTHLLRATTTTTISTTTMTATGPTFQMFGIRICR